MQQLVLCPSQRNYPPHGLVSWWDMLKFQAASFVNAMQALIVLHRIVKDFASEDVPSATVTEHISPLLKNLRDMLEPLQMPMSIKGVDRLLKLPEDNERIPKSELTDFLLDLSRRVRDELDSRHLFSVDRNAKFLEDGSLPFGDTVPTKFPSTRYEIEEAGKCLALRRPTACVMHLMRVAEVGLGALAGKLSVPFAHTNWHTVLDQVEAKIKTMSSATHGPSWRDDQQFYSEGAVHLRLVKDAWRNHAMHVRVVYTEDKAEEMFQSMKSFMGHLATRLSE